MSRSLGGDLERGGAGPRSGAVLDHAADPPQRELTRGDASGAEEQIHRGGITDDSDSLPVADQLNLLLHGQLLC